MASESNSQMPGYGFALEPARDCLGNGPGRPVRRRLRHIASLGFWLGTLAVCAVAFPTLARAGVDRELSGLQQKAVDAYVEAYPSVSRTEAQRRVAMQDRLAELVDVIHERFGENLAGTWFDANNGGRLAIAIGGPGSALKESAVASIRALVAGAGAVNEVNLTSRADTLDVLKRGQRELNVQLATLLAQGKIATDLQLPENAVRILEARGLSTADQASVRAAVLSSEVRVEVRQTPDTSLEAAPAACTGKGGSNPGYLYCGLPLRGGVNIDSPSSTCTLGFNVQSSTGSPFILTAGHCLAGNSGTWSTSNAPGTFHSVGNRVDWRFGATGDFGLVRVNSDSHWYQAPPAGIVFVDYSPYSAPGDPATSHDPFYPIRRASYSSEGQVLCLTSGRRMSDGRYTDCSLVKDLNRSVTYTGGVTVNGLGVLGANASVHGSSGGPVYKAGSGYGLLSGFNKDINEEYYQGLTGALHTFDVSLPPPG